MGNKIQDILNQKPFLTLDDLESDSFFVRKDIKFISHVDLLSKVLESLDDDWKVLDVNGEKIQQYHSVYYDTQDYECYRVHHDERKNRKKFRFRTYGEGVTFFEVKTKTNKGITAKQRMPVSEVEWSKQVGSFLEIHSNFRSEDMQESVRIDYRRITLINETTKEKITIDTDLKVFDEDSEKIYKNILILELKQDYFNRYLATRRLMQELQLKPTSLSKYCIGVMECKEGIKTNRFKEKSRLLDKIEKARG